MILAARGVRGSPYAAGPCESGRSNRRPHSPAFLNGNGTEEAGTVPARPPMPAHPAPLVPFHLIEQREGLFKWKEKK